MAVAQSHARRHRTNGCGDEDEQPRGAGVAADRVVRSQADLLWVRLLCRQLAWFSAAVDTDVAADDSGHVGSPFRVIRAGTGFRNAAAKPAAGGDCALLEF